MLVVGLAVLVVVIAVVVGWVLVVWLVVVCVVGVGGGACGISSTTAESGGTPNLMLLS
jgi:hypothetical protein